MCFTVLCAAAVVAAPYFQITGNELPMRLSREKIEEREPIGIVIADGGSHVGLPRFAAFVWGPVPDDVEAPIVSRGLVTAA